MTRDPFLRLALIVSVSVWLAGLAVLQQQLGWWWFAAVLVGSLVQAAALTVVVAPPVEGEDSRRRFRQPRKGTKGFERIP